MIFVTLGTQASDFSRCMKMVERLVTEINIKDKVVAQTGYTSYHPACVECFNFVTEDKYQELVEQADLVISHAGTGALFSSIKKSKKVIAVARLAKYGEMVNNHQTEIVCKLAKEGYILDGTYDIKAAWEKLADFKPRKIDFHCEIADRIGQLLTEWGISQKKQ